MSHIPDSVLHDMILAIPDPKQRQALGDIIAGRIKRRVKCLSDACQGRVIGEMYGEGKTFVRPVPSEGQLWLLSYRPRLDGFMGFSCVCGNDSRLAAAEQGVEGIELNSIGRTDLEQIYSNIQRLKPEYPETEDGQEVDGFYLENVK